MDQLQTRLDALELHVQTLHQQMRTVTRQLRWWRGTALLLLGLGLISWPLSRATLSAQVGAAALTLEQRVAELEAKLKYLTTRIDSSGRPLMEVKGANLRLVNGTGTTGTANGLGNLIVGYNEIRQLGENIRTGSHNVIVGKEHNYSRFGGIVVGVFNTISGDFASVSGGNENTAAEYGSSVSGGVKNIASGEASSVSGGAGNIASGDFASVSGGQANTASASFASVTGGGFNTANGDFATVTGGGAAEITDPPTGNTASGMFATVTGGQGNTASGFGASVSGGQNNTAGVPLSEDLGLLAVVSGGSSNTATGFASVVSGGRNRTAEGAFDWVAGSLLEDE